MKLRDKKTGIIGELHFNPDKEYHFRVVTEDPADMAIYKKLATLHAEWEDYDEPKKYKYALPNKVRRAILSWVKAQDNPIEKISILLKSYYDTHEVDSDGFYDYEFYGYVGDNNKNLTANTLSIRLKKPFDYEEDKDYTLPELGIFGGEKMRKFEEGELFIYINGDRAELGKVKRKNDDGDGYFCYYSSGETAADTPVRCMYKLVNDYTIKGTTLGGEE